MLHADLASCECRSGDTQGGSAVAPTTASTIAPTTASTTATAAWTRAAFLCLILTTAALILTTAALVAALTTTVSASAATSAPPAPASASSPGALLSASSAPAPAAVFPRWRACSLTCQSLADCPRSFDGLRHV